MCVLYEMLTGKRAFGADNVSETVAAVLRSEPDWTVLPSDTPAAMRRLLNRFLRKDAEERLRDINDARIEIHDPHAESSKEPALPVGIRFGEPGECAA